MLHRLLADVPKGLFVDHRDGDGRNNRRSNIRVATTRENRRNETKLREHTSSYRGASWSEDSQGWQARCGIGTQHLHLGIFNTAIEAALAYDKAAREHFGEFASTNFTEEEAAAMAAPIRRRRKTRDDLPHGSRGRYKYCGCRCDECREAENAYQRQRYHQMKAAA